jgi:prepilin-type N-terminal cleavage/methylation domain-containing protein
MTSGDNNRPRRRQFTLIEVLVGLGVVGILILFLAPLISLHPREWYGGKDQYEWAAALRSEDPEKREEAVAALCEIMRRRPAKLGVRQFVGQALVEAKAVEAVPALREMLQSDDEDLRGEARRALQQLDPKALE